MVQIKELNKKIKKNHILKDINFTFDKKTYGLLGPNGSGKTTLLRCLTKVYNLTSGDVLFDGNSVFNDKKYITHVGYLPQSFGAFKNLTVYEMLSYFATAKGMKNEDIDADVKKQIEIVNLTEKEKAKVKSLSGGMVRRLGIAQALLGDADILILDEPTVGLDPEERLNFKTILTKIKKDKMIILSTHIVEDVEALCDDIIVMGTGNILKSGTRSEIRAVAEGKVYIVPEGENEKLNGIFKMQKLFEKDDKQYMRILSAEKQDFPLAEPTIEDGYLCALNNI